MSQVQLYTKVFIYINNSLLTQNANVKLTRNAALLPAHNTYQGFAGFTQGAPHLEIEAGNIVPLAGFEYNPGPDELNSNIVTVTLVAADQTLTTDGGITGDDLSYAIDNHTVFNFHFYGEYADWQAA